MSDFVYNSGEKKWLAFLILSLLLGSVLRLSFPGDIEYKSDEKYMFEAVHDIGSTGTWPVLGMKSGVEVKNPGMSVWIFAALSKISHAATPPELARTVQLLNILGLMALAYFSLRVLPLRESVPWRWAAAFSAVNPFAVLFARKIWAQCTLPLFCVLFWISWHYRKERSGAFFWGLIGICLGQIHISGFFLAAGVFLWTVTHDRRARWGYWLTGSLLGAIPLIPWVQYFLAEPGTSARSMSLKFIPQLKYWVFWVTDPLGLGLVYSLKTQQFMDYLRYPLVGGNGTYIVGALHGLILIIGIWIVVAAVKAKRPTQGNVVSPETGLAVNSAFIATGVLMTLSCVEIMRHYLIVSFPLEWVWMARLGLLDRQSGQRNLALLWGAQLLITIAFLSYIHINHGAVSGDYGTAYQYQATTVP